VLAKPRKRPNGELLDETKWVEYTGMDRAALIKKGCGTLFNDRLKARKAV
jgi:hypothetical protein